MQTTPQLRPMSIGDVLDAAFRLYRQHFLVFLGISALLQVPMAVLQSVAQYVLAGQAFRDIMAFAERPPIPRPGQSPLEVLPVQQYLVLAGVTAGISLLYYLVVYNLTTAALANAVAQARQGRPVSILGAYALSPRTYLALIAASTVPVVGSVLIFGVTMGCAIGAAGVVGSRLEGGGIAAVIVGTLLALGLVMLLLLLLVFIFVRLALTTQVIVLERAGPLRGIGRSWRLTGPGFWRVLLAVVLMGIISYAVSSLPATVVSTAVTIASGSPLNNFGLNQGLTSLVAYAGLILALPLQLAVYTVLYDDLRVRSEGYDLELRANQI
ncbi:MAG TPA: hypothetical protein VNL77_19320 [Roseiflexaceae bacterium]|nr:hypothetical protein [Roseiflexaceae bacterium]